MVRTTVEKFLDCGRLINGFARIRCPSCKGEHLLAFSCRTRNFCPSCQAKRAALFAEGLRERILLPVRHRHWIFTIPKVLRRLFERDRKLLGILSRSAYGAVRRAFGASLDRRDVVPGFVASIQTFGAFANFHPHIHALVTEGVVTEGGEFVATPPPDAALVEEVFRRLVLERLHAAERLSGEFRHQLLSWVHSGFSVKATQVVTPEEPEAVERLARYTARAPFQQDGVKATEKGQISFPTPCDPRTGVEDLLLDPLDWVHAVTTQIPDRGQHQVRYYGAYACRTRGSRNKRTTAPVDETQASPPDTSIRSESDAHHANEESEFSRARRANWARLLRKIFEVDPLICPKCGVEMTMVSVITSPDVVDRILRHVEQRGHRDPFESRPPP